MPAHVWKKKNGKSFQGVTSVENPGVLFATSWKKKD